MKALILVLSVLSLVACGKNNKTSSSVSSQPFNYECEETDNLEEGFTFYACTEKTTGEKCETITSDIEYFNDTDCKDFDFEKFKRYLSER